MAEGFAKSLKGDKYKFHSAGTQKHGINQRAVKVMSEVGIDISNHTSNIVDELGVDKFDLVITVCSDANENCPFIPGAKITHVGFEDPPRLTKGFTDEEETLKVYRSVRDEIRAMVEKIDSLIES